MKSPITQELNRIFLGLTSTTYWDHFKIKVGNKVMSSNDEIIDWIKSKKLNLSRDFNDKIDIYPESLSTRSLVRVLIINNIKISRV